MSRLRGSEEQGPPQGKVWKESPDLTESGQGLTTCARQQSPGA